MPGADEFTDPVAYATVWTVVAVVLPLLVVGWYAGAAWLTRDATVDHRPDWWRLRRARRNHLRRLDRIAADRRRGVLSTRTAHQEVSATVRSFIADVGLVDARVMNLEQLRAAGPPQAVTVVELAYPPSFGPTAEPVDRLDDALDEARRLVAGWQR